MDNILYKYKLEEGSGDTNYGIEIAKAIGLDKDFIKESFKFRNKFNNEPIQLLSNKRSRYNNKIIVDQCSKCGSKHNLHTHHIEEQRKANSNGIIEFFRVFGMPCELIPFIKKLFKLFLFFKFEARYQSCQP